ncbi:MAG: penicillin-binding protein 2 [Anaerolineales bacterium]|nr:penicillin-binding protein 2 [Anaerolineales bacterium]MCB8953877.1 penicillin-binding protein 2 [Ardenticatenales bacterium]
MSRIGWERPEDREDLPDDRGLRGRLFFLRIFMVIILGGLLYRVIWLQQTQGQDLQAQAQENRFAVLTTNPPRGVIFDRNGEPLAENIPSFNVTITEAFLPTDEAEREAIFARLSLLTGVPITNTVQQEALVQGADPTIVGTYSRLSQLFNAPVNETLDLAGIVPQLPDSIAGLVETYSFAPNVPFVITRSIPITMAYEVELESPFLPGVRVIEEPIRRYPSGDYTAHIIGYMGPIPDESYLDRYERDDRVGWAGLEYAMEDMLAGTKGERQIEVDWRGRELRQIGLEVPPQAGYNLYLTLDVELQKQVYQILEEWMQRRRETPDTDPITGEKHSVEVEQGAVVVLNPNTGEILALANIPTFDNNRFSTEVPVDYYLSLARNDYTPLVNHAISGQYPPGSTFKLVTAAAAMQYGVISPSRALFDPGSITVPNRFAPLDPGRAQRFVCWNLEGHGAMNMVLAIANSCDVYFYKVAGGFNQDGEVVDAVGVDRLHDMAVQWGFGRTQGLELPLESPGNIPTQAWKRQTQGEPWSTGDDYNMAIGQGFVTSTPLQVAQMAAIVANKGFLYQPTIIHHVTDGQGNIVQDFEPVVLNAVDVDRNYLDVIAEGMRLVNHREEQADGSIKTFGTAGSVEWLDQYGIVSAGKTGTAEYCDNIAIERRWCKEGQILPTHSWYVGYAPFDNPEIVVAAFIFNGGEGSAWSAPIVRDVMEAYFHVGKFAPTEEGE